MTAFGHRRRLDAASMRLRYSLKAAGACRRARIMPDASTPLPPELRP
jgi:hypothetical protein